MRFGITVFVLGVLAQQVWAVQNAVSVDYTGDCAVNTQDAGAFLSAYAGGSVEADLTGDGLATVQDVLVFLNHMSVDPGPFAIHWTVTTSYGEKPYDFGYRMDGSFGEDPNRPDIDKTHLPLTLDTAMIYERMGGVYPRTGLHEIFLRLGDPSLWQESYADWKSEHRQVILARVPHILASQDPPYTYGIVDFESWYLLWMDMRVTQPKHEPSDYACRAWVDLVDDINTPVWDHDFFINTGFTPPAGTTGIGDLTLVERESAYNGTWNRWAHRLYSHTLNSLREADDATGDVKWSFWRYPQVHFDRPVNDEDRARNDELSWLWRETDVLGPRFYRRRFTSEDPYDPGSCDEFFNRSPDHTAEVWSSAMVEMIRLKNTYKPDAEIIPVLWWHYQFGPDCRYQFLNPLDVADAIRIPRRWGADGVYIWGYYNPDPYNNGSEEPVPVDDIQYHIDTEWRDLLNDAACGG